MTEGRGINADRRSGAPCRRQVTCDAPALEEAALFPCCRAKRLALAVAELHGPTALNHGCLSWPPEPNQKMPALAATVSAARPMMGATTNRVSVAPTIAPAS